jgi:hypothetical protein
MAVAMVVAEVAEALAAVVVVAEASVADQRTPPLKRARISGLFFCGNRCGMKH